MFIPPVDRREDIPEAKLPCRKRLCLTTGGHRVDYGFIGTMEAKARRQRAETVGYGIRDTWVDPREATEEIASVTLEGVNTRTQIYQTVEALVDDRQYHYETARLLDQEALVSREAWAHTIGLRFIDSGSDRTASTTNNMPPRRSSTTARAAAAAAAALLTATAVEQLIEA
ncbi:hypothetical protein Tco_1580635 [Tanacetum coccineum]